jgi:hypothetical protein
MRKINNDFALELEHCGGVACCAPFIFKKRSMRSMEFPVEQVTERWHTILKPYRILFKALAPTHRHRNQDE